jgi:hypothetical protein
MNHHEGEFLRLQILGYKEQLEGSDSADWMKEEMEVLAIGG